MGWTSEKRGKRSGAETVADNCAGGLTQRTVCLDQRLFMKAIRPLDHSCHWVEGDKKLVIRSRAKGSMQRTGGVYRGFWNWLRTTHTCPDCQSTEAKGKETLKYYCTRTWCLLEFRNFSGFSPFADWLTESLMSWSENGSSWNVFTVDMALSCYLREVYLMGNLQRFNMKKTNIEILCEK